MSIPIVGTAIFDPTEAYRYVLTRELNASISKSMLAVCLNPSTATAEENDPTVRRLMGYALAWGFGRLTVCNIFAFRGTDPRSLYKTSDPIGPDNDRHIREQALRHDLVLCGWGNHGCQVKSHGGDFTKRGRDVRQLLESAGVELRVFGLTSKMEPLHPLYLANAMPVIPWDFQARGRTVDWYSREKGRVA